MATLSSLIITASALKLTFSQESDASRVACSSANRHIQFQRAATTLIQNSARSQHQLTPRNICNTAMRVCLEAACIDRQSICKRQTSPHSAAALRRGHRRQRRSHQQIAGRTETCRGSNSVVNLVLEDLDEPLNPENEGGSFSDFQRSHVK